MGNDENAEAPGQAPLDAAATTWICSSGDAREFIFLSDRDMTTGDVPMPGHEFTRCVKLDDVYDVARGIYYAKKILDLGRKGASKLAPIPGENPLLPDDG